MKTILICKKCGKEIKIHNNGNLLSIMSIITHIMSCKNFNEDNDLKDKELEKLLLQFFDVKTKSEEQKDVL